MKSVLMTINKKRDSLSILVQNVIKILIYGTLSAFNDDVKIVAELVKLY